MSMTGLTNNTMTTYRYTKGVTYPYLETGTWAATVVDEPCYVSDATLKRITDDGTAYYVQVRRVRTSPYAWAKGDRVYLDGKIYETLSYENFDGLGLEAVTICEILDDKAIAETVGA